MATINASACTRAAVNAAITSAVNGDIVIVPAGTATDWTAKVDVTKSLTIQGQTTTNSATGTANDQSIIRDNLVDVPGGQPFFDCTTNVGQSLRITGFTFTGVGGTRGTTMYNGAIKFVGSSTQVRIDHCHFTGGLQHLNYLALGDHIYGVADHLVIDGMPSQHGQQRAFNGTGNGDLEFSQSIGFGSANFFFMEDCYLNNTNGAFNASGGWDSAIGGKFVVRYCHLFDIEILNHGTEDGRIRGGRGYELYNNDYHWSYTTTMDGIRSGTMLAHDNTFVGNVPTGYGLQTYRTFYNWGTGTWKGAAGDNAWDYNATESNGTHVDGHAAFLFASGTFTAGTTGNTLIDNSKSWTINQWIGYEVKKVSDGSTGYILSNTSNTLTVMQWNDQGFASGQTYQIHLCLRALDQPGSGAGDLITGSNPTPAWPNQVREPCYSWNNIHSPSGTHINFSPLTNASMVANLDYFEDTAMPGYSPYTYPHPLTGGVTGKVIDVPVSHNFGNVTVGQTATYDIPVQNLGDQLLSISAVSYPTGYSGPTGAFTVLPGGSTTKTATFSPVAAITYSGNIVFTSDSTSGNGTMAVTGVGTTASGGGHGRGHKKGVLVAKRR